MARQIFINVDTTLNEIQVTDADTATGEVFLDYFGKVGEPMSLERSEVLALTDADASIKVNTKHGSTGFFKFADIDDVQLDGVSIGAADLADVLNGIGSYLFTSVSGGGVSTSTATFNFASGNQYKAFHRIGWAGSVTAVATTNVTSYTIYKNGVAITPLVLPVAIAQGDRLYVEIVATNTALAASIVLTVEGLANAVSYASLSYYYPRVMDFTENMTTLPNYIVDTDQSMKGTGYTSNFLNNVIYGDPVRGEFDLIYRPLVYSWLGAFYYGLNDRTASDTTANRYPRMRYCVYLNDQNFRVYEFGTLKVGIGGVSYPQLRQYKIESRQTSPGVYTVKYYDSLDDGSTWTLRYTSLDTHNGTTDFYPDVVHERFYYAQMQPPTIVKL